jgi:hypothetical protein
LAVLAVVGVVLNLFKVHMAILIQEYLLLVLTV